LREFCNSANSSRQANYDQLLALIHCRTNSCSSNISIVKDVDATSPGMLPFALAPLSPYLHAVLLISTDPVRVTSLGREQRKGSKREAEAEAEEAPIIQAA